MSNSAIYEALIIEHIEVSPGYRKIVAESPALSKSALPGQFVHVLCGVHGHDPLLRRPFGIHWADPVTGRFGLMYEVRGKGTEVLSTRRPGEKLSLIGPLGDGFNLSLSESSSAVLVGGGIGAVPLYFLAKALSSTIGSERITLIMGACTMSKLFFMDDFAKLCSVDPGDGQYYLCTDDGTCGHHGFVTDILAEHLSKGTNDESPVVYACGPVPMLKAVSGVAERFDVRCQISTEAKMACGIGACMGCVVKVRSGAGEKYVRACKEGPVFDSRDVVWE